MRFDIGRARRETPGCQNVMHFNNAGASLPPHCVVEAQVSHLYLEAEMGGYEAQDYAREKVARLYGAAADLLGCGADEIAFTASATTAWDLAFYSLRLGPGDRILTCMAEYASNYIAFLQVAARTGVKVEVIPNDAHGQISVDALRQAIDERVKLIAITHVPSSGGLVNPVAAVGQVAKEAGILYLLDACQSVGQMPIHVDEIGCDMLATTGRKYLRAPRGTGFLYLRKATTAHLEPVFLDLHAASWVAQDRYEVRTDARRFESWEASAAGRIGLGVAIDYARSWGLEVTYARIQALADRLRRALGALPGVAVQDTGAERCGIVTFTAAGHEPREIQDKLAKQGINVLVTSLFSTRLDLAQRGLTRMVRASVHYYNTEEEIAALCTAIEGL